MAVHWVTESNESNTIVGTLVCAAAATGTAGTMAGIGVGAGDEVLVPDVTFIATANAVTLTGAKPVLVDVDPRNLNIDPHCIEKAITARTKAILPVHLFGQVAEMEPINAVAARHGLRVIEDAAQAVGAKRHGRPTCSLSFAGCLSFYPTKNLGAFGDGGAVLTGDSAIRDHARCLLG